MHVWARQKAQHCHLPGTHPMSCDWGCKHFGLSRVLDPPMSTSACQSSSQLCTTYLHLFNHAVEAGGHAHRTTAVESGLSHADTAGASLACGCESVAQRSQYTPAPDVAYSVAARISALSRVPNRGSSRQAALRKSGISPCSVSCALFSLQSCHLDLSVQA